MDVMGQLTINGIAAGAMYAMAAVGFAIIYGTTHIFHMAYGAKYTLTGYVVFVLAILLKINLLVSFLLAVVVVAAVGMGMEHFIYRPMRAAGAGFLALFLSSLGLLYLFENLMILVFGNDIRVLREGPLDTIRIGGLSITALHILVIIMAIVVFVCLFLFLKWTKTGKAVRALANNGELASLVGVDADRLRVFVFGLGSALVALAALPAAFEVSVTPGMGWNIVMVAAVAVIMGGVGHLPGAALGGLSLGIIQNVAMWQIPVAWQEVIVFVVLVVILLLRPGGFFGERVTTHKM